MKRIEKGRLWLLTKSLSDQCSKAQYRQLKSREEEPGCCIAGQSDVFGSSISFMRANSNFIVAADCSSSMIDFAPETPLAYVGYDSELTVCLRMANFQGPSSAGHTEFRIIYINRRTDGRTEFRNVLRCLKTLSSPNCATKYYDYSNCCLETPCFRETFGGSLSTVSTPNLRSKSSNTCCGESA